MNKFVVGAGILALSAAVAANAGTHPSKEESIGLVGGAAIGAAAGGPVGAIVGIVLGGWIGDRMDTKTKTVATLNQRVVESDRTMTALNFRLIESQHALADLNLKLADTERRFALVAPAEGGGLTPAIERTLRGEIMFRTKDATLSAGTSAHLMELAEVLAVTSDALVQLDGYADPRGTRQENLVLSEQRAASVRDSLIAGGLPAERIVIRAHGEGDAQSVAGDVDGFALERRVVITIGGAQTSVAWSD